MSLCKNTYLFYLVSDIARTDLAPLALLRCSHATGINSTDGNKVTLRPSLINTYDCVTEYFPRRKELNNRRDYTDYY